MRKKYSKQKEGRGREGRQGREGREGKEGRRCGLCAASAAGTTADGSSLLVGNLKRKYYYPQIETYHYRSANNLIYDPYSREAVELAETQKLLGREQMLGGYLAFAQTVQVIRGAVQRRVEKDFYGWVDFRDDHYAITNNYYLRRKHLTRNSKKMQKYLATCPPSEHLKQYFEDRVKKELDNQRLVKLSQNDTNSSTVDLQRLTRNLEGMISKIADLSVIRPFPHAHRAHRGKAQNNLSLLFKAGSTGDISAIGKTEEQLAIADPSSPDRPNHYQESYGLETIRPKNQKAKKLNKLSLRSIDKLSGFEERTRATPETPKPRCFQGETEYEEVEFNSPGSWGRANHIARKKGQSPMSPGNNHSSSLKNSKTLSRNGSHTKKTK